MGTTSDKPASENVEAFEQLIRAEQLISEESITREEAIERILASQLEPIEGPDEPA